MVLAKSKNAVGLGNSLMNDRFGKGKSSMHKNSTGGITRTGEDGQRYITNNKKEAAWVKMRSVTEQAALDEFLSTAELAGTDFTAEKMNNVKIIHKDQKNPYLLSAAEERAVARKHEKNKDRLTVPRRPPWDKNTTPDQLDHRERESFLEWRRGLAELQENLDLLMTPFERNLEVWRQLWRVIERSDLVVQIVDARNPLMFRSEDLELYVKQIDKKKRNLLLVNKADMMTLEQRKAWADYFTKSGIRFRFFSAELAKEANESRDGQSDDEEGALDKAAAKLNIEDEADEEDDEENDEEGQEEEEEEGKDEEEEEADELSDDEADAGVTLSPSEQTRILTTDDLEALFLSHAPSTDKDHKLQIGLVGYPNVGKSSTINSLLGAKKVSVSATPGKTKHFQTIHLSQRIVLCDCPGLVFPNFASTKAELVVNGVLPIDQLREWMGPMGLVAKRIPRQWLEAVYGIKIEVRSEEEGGTGQATGEEVSKAFALARGYRAGGAAGQVDESRAARVVLKDFVKGKLLHCHSPPGWDSEGADFNAGLYDIAHLPERRRRVLEEMEAAHSGSGALTEHTFDDDADMLPLTDVPGPRQGPKTQALDKRFFAPGQGRGQVTMPFHHKYSEQGQAQAEAEASGKQLSGRKARAMVALQKDLDPEDVKMMGSGKKHFKGNKRAMKKVRSEYE
ncbi:P-loop containing nucleoside triphosphate hydrolase protein [Myriangium duriaei CBS 260.36]|uniref:P-loop containing nucleoside triphosphate hydrolase protein n=1 Tax=Myriangium duriaei CBS 260.36 TaxID=1168546 RepID=A0A9P4JDE9_9PEZI|nr:P-loop containing nucleoside triphosphate hydrolase protein [Myriangium duriaei CBS 260.36]